MIKVNGHAINFNTFPNGETKIDEDSIIKAFEESRAQNKIIFKYKDDADLIQLYMLKSYVSRYRKGVVGTLHLIILYMPYSRTDRVEANSAFTLKYIADFINQMNFDEVVVYEPHSDVTPALINNSSTISLIGQFLGEVVEDIGFDPVTDVVVFPDATANKRYSYVNAPNTLTGLKHRNFKTGRIESLDLVGRTRNKGFKALMLDDLCSYGGTFLMTATELKKMGANEIYLFVGHCEDSIFEGEIFKSGLIDKVFTTNSILTEQSQGDWSNLIYKDKMKVFDAQKELRPQTTTFN